MKEWHAQKAGKIKELVEHVISTSGLSLTLQPCHHTLTPSKKPTHLSGKSPAAQIPCDWSLLCSLSEEYLARYLV